MDFGVARLVEHTTVLTQAGMVVGTPAYMSPEQLLAEDVDGRSDLYSAGVVLYECLTGRLPFEARTPISLIAKLLHDEPVPPATPQPRHPARPVGPHHASPRQVRRRAAEGRRGAGRAARPPRLTRPGSARRCALPRGQLPPSAL